MNLDSLLDRLSNVRQRRGYLMARCPAHEDRVQSLSVIILDSGKPWFTCHAGCSYEEIIEAMGDPNFEPLELERGKDIPTHVEEKPAHLTGFEAIYDYEDENGQLLFKVCRTHDKRFFQCHPDAESPTGFYWGLNGVRRVPYRLSRVREAVKAAQTVYIVEGEKDVHAVEEAGGVATCNPMGASKGKSKWRSEWNEYFEGALVVVVADRDEAGKAHAIDIGESLAGVVQSVWLVLPAEGKDAFDHFQARFGLDEWVDITPFNWPVRVL